MTSERIHRATSSDGTVIAGRVHGQGPPLVLVPGGPADGETGWESLLPCLIDAFTCFTLNLRGRALSEDHPDHSHDRLVEDVVAFIESIGDDVCLFGHSAGGTLSLEAAARLSAVDALALYEPALFELADVALAARLTDGLVRVRRAVDEGRMTDAVRIFLEDVALANEHELALLADAGAEQEMAPLVPVVLDEVDQSGLPRLSDLALLEQVSMPVLLLHGARTHPFYTGALRFLAGRLRESAVREIPDVGHLGPEVDPRAVATALTRLAA